MMRAAGVHRQVSAAHVGAKISIDLKRICCNTERIVRIRRYRLCRRVCDITRKGSSARMSLCYFLITSASDIDDNAASTAISDITTASFKLLLI